MLTARPWRILSGGTVPEATPTAHPVAVIGGYQQGGATDSVSYSVYLGSAIQKLCQQAEAPSTA